VGVGEPNAQACVDFANQPDRNKAVLLVVAARIYDQVRRPVREWVNHHVDKISKAISFGEHGTASRKVHGIFLLIDAAGGIEDDP